MEHLVSILSEEWALRAIGTTILIGITCGIIGSFIVLRNMSLIGDGLSHAILPGIFVAFVLVGYNTLGFFIGSVIAGIITATLITWIQQYVKTKSDAAIGIVFTFMFSLGVIGISWLNSRQGVHLDLQDFLFGTVMGISDEDIVLTLIVAVYTIVSVYLFYRYLFITTFQPTIAQTMGISVKFVHYFLMLLLSFAIVAALRAVGVILVVAMLITPASTALLLSDRLKRVIFLSAGLGALSAVIGIVGAIYFDTPPGPAMVVVSAIMYLTASLFAPSKGVVVKWIQDRAQRKLIEREDILKYLSKGRTNASPASISEALEIPMSRVANRISEMTSSGLLMNKGGLLLSAKGSEKAAGLVRAHRLWETYQVDKMGLNQEQIHDEAESFEHLLSDEILDEVDRKLGYPETDPHGSPIPPRSVRNNLLVNPLNKRVRIVKDQLSEHIESELWELGLMPDMMVTIKTVTADAIIVKHQQKLIEVPAEIARQVRVA